MKKTLLYVIVLAAISFVPTEDAFAQDYYVDVRPNGDKILTKKPIDGLLAQEDHANYHQCRSTAKKGPCSEIDRATWEQHGKKFSGGYYVIDTSRYFFANFVITRQSGVIKHWWARPAGYLGSTYFENERTWSVYDTDAINTKLNTLEKKIKDEVVSSIDALPQRLVSAAATQVIKDAIMAELRTELDKVRKDLQDQIDELKFAK